MKNNQRGTIVQMEKLEGLPLADRLSKTALYLERQIMVLRDEERPFSNYVFALNQIYNAAPEIKAEVKKELESAPIGYRRAFDN